MALVPPPWQVFAAGDAKREDIILQTKVGAKSSPEDMRAALEVSFKRLQVSWLSAHVAPSFAQRQFLSLSSFPARSSEPVAINTADWQLSAHWTRAG